MLESLARWYLKRRGFIVLDRAFRGIALGGAVAVQHPDKLWVVHSPVEGATLIAANHAVFIPYVDGAVQV
jgi:hypothetical protein